MAPLPGDHEVGSAAASTDAAPRKANENQEELTSHQDQAKAQEDIKTDQETAEIAKIEELLRAKDDTSRFVGLALLKAVLDNQGQPAGEAAEAAATAPSPLLLRLWDILPVKFLDKLLRTGINSSASFATTSSQPQSSKAADAAHMRDLAVAVLHTFAVRVLPDDRRGDERLVNRIPLLVASLLNSDSSSGAVGASTSASASGSGTAAAEPASTTTLILQTLATLVSRPTGAAVLNGPAVADLSPLTELAPAQPLVLEILLHAWLYGLLDADAAHRRRTADRVNATLPALVAAFKGTDGVTLLAFLARLLRNAAAFAEQKGEPALLPQPEPTWLRPVSGFVRGLVASRPTAAARAAYTHVAAALLRAYPAEASSLLFGEAYDRSPTKKDDGKPFAYLFVSLLLVDLRATLPGLLAVLNDKEGYAAAASRLASAYDVLSAFVGFLVRALDDDGEGERLTAALTPDNLLRLRTSIAEALSLTAEHLRDRWDAAVAGAQGLHPDARPGELHQLAASGGPAGPPLAWDAADADTAVHRDPLVLAALRCLALWLREDDNDALRREAAGLADMLLDLYASSDDALPQNQGNLDFRRPVLVALEGIIASADGEGQGGDDDEDEDGADKSTVALLLEHDAWQVLTTDLLHILQATTAARSGAQRSTSMSSSSLAAAEAARGVEVVRVLLPIVEGARPGTEEAWMDVVTHVAAWAGPDAEDAAAADRESDDAIRGGSAAAAAAVIAEFQVAVLQLVTALVANAHPALRRRYTLSISAVVGLAQQLRQALGVAAARYGPASIGLVEALGDVLTTLNNLR